MRVNEGKAYLRGLRKLQWMGQTLVPATDLFYRETQNIRNSEGYMIRVFVMLTLILTNFGLGQQLGWTITMKNGEQMMDVVLHGVETGSLITLQSGPFGFIPIIEIDEIRLDNSGYRRGARTVLGWIGIGVVTGVITAVVIGDMERANSPPPPPSRPGAIIGDNIDFGSGFDAMAGGLIGSVVGIIVGSWIYHRPISDKVYSFKKLDDEQKVKLLQKLIEQGKENHHPIFWIKT